MENRYVILPGTNADSSYTKEYAAAYDLWLRTWQSTFGQLDGLTRLHSDDFTRQETIGAIFENERCLALIFMRESDLSSKAARQDSYFAPWTPEAMDQLVKDGCKILIGSYITVDADFRGDRPGRPRLKSLLLELAVQHLLISSCAAMTGITRRDKGIQKVAYRLGADLLKENVTYHGVPTDLVAWYKQKLIPRFHLSPEAQLLWRNREAGQLGHVIEQPYLKIA